MLPPMANNSRHHPQGVLRSKARPRFSRVPKRPTAQWEARDAETASDAEIAGLDLVVCAQFFGLGRIDYLALAHHMHVIDKLESEVGILLHQQDGQTFFFESADCLPKPLDDDRGQAFRRLVHN